MMSPWSPYGPPVVPLWFPYGSPMVPLPRIISGVLFANVMFLALQLQFEGSRVGGGAPRIRAQVLVAKVDMFPSSKAADISGVAMLSQYSNFMDVLHD